MDKKVKRVYVSGPISNKDAEIQAKNIEAFYKAEELIKSKYPDLVVVNPCRLDHSKSESWRDYMRVDLKAMLDCSHICRIPGWEGSMGAYIESIVALGLELEKVTDIWANDD